MKEYVYIPISGDKIYISNDLKKLLKLSNEEYFCSTCNSVPIYLLKKDKQKYTLFHLDFSNIENPVEKEKYIYWTYIKKLYSNRKFVRM